MPIVAVTEDAVVPYVLADDLVRVPPGQGFPIDEIAAAMARRLGDEGVALAARLPVLRRAVCDHLIDAARRRTALIAAAVFVPGVDLPLLTMNQIRLVLRIALAYGEELDQNACRRDRRRRRRRLTASGRSRASLLDLVPVAGWAVKGAVAYSGTRAVGEAAVRSARRASSARRPSRPVQVLRSFETTGR